MVRVSKTKQSRVSERPLTKDQKIWGKPVCPHRASIKFRQTRRGKWPTHKKEKLSVTQSEHAGSKIVEQSAHW